MRYIFFLILSLLSFSAHSEKPFSTMDCDTKKFIADQEVRHSSAASWKYRILNLLDQGKVEEAMKEIIVLQSFDLFALEQIEKERELSAQTKSVIEQIKEYNQSRDSK